MIQGTGSILDKTAMEVALQLASRAQGQTAPNPKVGAVVTDFSGQIVGQGFHPKAGSPHAEVFAVEDALKVQSDLSDTTLYVTLEPCNHHGRTPPCVDLILKNKIPRVVIGALDPNPLMQGKSVQRLREAGVDVRVGVLSSSAEKLIRGFRSVIKTSRPFITLKCATSLDGKIATGSGESKWITEEPARDLAHRERAEHDAILVGIGTILSDDPHLNIRLGDSQADIRGRMKVVLDSRLRTPATARIFQTPGAVLIYCDSAYSKERQEILQNAGAIIIPVPNQGALDLDLDFILKDLARRGVQDLMVEGGARVLGSFVKQKLFDRMIYFISPKILGSEGKDVFDGLESRPLKDSVELDQMTTRLIGRDIVIEGVNRCLQV